MIRLFRAFSLRYLYRRRLRFSLAGVSVALAVALFVSMRATEHSILRAFERSVERLAGKADAVVTRGAGVNPEALARVESVPGVRAAPLVQEPAAAPELGRTLLVLGIDFVRDAALREYRLDAAGADVDVAALLLRPDAVIVARSLATRHGLARGSTLTLQTRAGLRPFTLAGIFDAAGPAEAVAGDLVVMGLASAQRAFGRRGRWDRIEVALGGASLETLRAALGPDYTVQPIPRTNPVMDYQLSQFRTIFFGVSVLAMLIGAFIIFNSLSLSVVERVKEIGVLRALGARRREVVGAIALEAGLVGLLASAAGVGLGIGLARLALRHVAGFINLFAQVVDVREVTVPWEVPATAIAVGVSTALAGGVLPALAAARVAPMVAIRRATYEQGLRRGYVLPCAAGAVLFALALACGARPGAGREVIILSMIGAVCGFALALPQIILTCSGGFRLLARRFLRIESTLAVDTIVKHPVRTALTVIAFAGSLSLVVTVWGALHSFETSVHNWLHSIMPWDLTIQLRDLGAGVYDSATFSDSLAREVVRDPRVDRAYGVRVQYAPFRDTTVMVLAIDMREFMDLRVELGRFADAAEAERRVAALQGGAVLVSENFAHLAGVRPGEEIELGTGTGPRRFRVLATMEDYSWPRGVVMLDRGVYRELWDDDGLTYLDLRVHPGADVAAVRADLARSLQGRYRAFLYETHEIRDQARRVIREWFTLADAQVLLAVLIGGIGVVNTGVISLITRARQIGILRAVGASHGQICLSLGIEAAWVGTLSGLLGVAMGLFVIKFPIQWITLQSSGYTLPFLIPWKAVTVSLVGGVVIGVLAGLIPMRWVGRIDVVEAIGYE